LSPSPHGSSRSHWAASGRTPLPSCYKSRPLLHHYQSSLQVFRRSNLAKLTQIYYYFNRGWVALDYQTERRRFSHRESVLFQLHLRLAPFIAQVDHWGNYISHLEIKEWIIKGY